MVERFVSLAEIKLSEGSVSCLDSIMEYDPEKLNAKLTQDTCVRGGGVRETLYILDLEVKCPEKNMEFTFKFS